MKYLICGLGNIGAEYDQTRHNIGFMVVDALAAKYQGSFSVGKHASVAEIKFKGRTLILVKPTTYMNLSGKAYQYWLREHKLEMENSMVITDDLAIPFGSLRLRAKGSHGGHNGLAHIQEIMNSDAFPRLRFGIGNNFSKGHQSNYVLSKFSIEEQKDLALLIEKCISGIETFATVGISQSMNFVNTK